VRRESSCVSRGVELTAGRCLGVGHITPGQEGRGISSHKRENPGTYEGPLWKEEKGEDRSDRKDWEEKIFTLDGSSRKRGKKMKEGLACLSFWLGDREFRGEKGVKSQSRQGT